MNKIFLLKELGQIIKKVKLKNKKISLCHGVFDALHYGHIKHFEFAKKKSDILVVTITADKYINKGGGRPYFNEMIRAEVLKAIKIIDYIAIIYDESAIPALKEIKPNFYIKGDEYKIHENDISKKIKKEFNILKKFGGKLLYSSEVTYSSSNLISNKFGFLNEQQKKYINKIKRGYHITDIEKYFDKMKNKNLIIFGETIIDKYIYCDVLGKAGKEPVLNIKQIDNDIFVGGVLPVANMASNFCKSVTVISYLGENNEYYSFIKKNLNKNVKFLFISKEKSPTIEKTRYLDSTKRNKFLGIYDINDRELGNKEKKDLDKLILKNITKKDISIILDFGHGFLDKSIIRTIAKNSKFLSVNTQLNSSNIGFNTISKYKNLNYVCMHEGELRHDFREKNKNIKDLSKELLKKINAKKAIITKGKEGAIIINSKGKICDCPAMIKESNIKDKIGAGDTLFGITSLLVNVNCPDELILLIGNIAAARNVSGLANSMDIGKMDILSTLQTLFKYS